ncbi:hypothetical protein PF005_g31748 [Phytophthora fragariae]|uniref:Uncharacterized protein n=2 Tax=Phytophthora fragariae TaxID=53985 RepID=A0A6A3GI76_9STRA|nr:hypothetical protein PF011_g30729 [Phytophthora fragariae]KAE9160184.1 hypothetical protein PF005_g31748 [Phytophthora fragariae]
MCSGELRDDSDANVDTVDAAADGYTVVTPTPAADTEDPVIMKTTSALRKRECRVSSGTS